MTSNTSTGACLNRDTIILNHQHLVDRLVVCLLQRRPLVQRRLEVEDLKQEGSIGLIKAVDSFDESKGASLTSWAVTCITSALMVALRSAGLSAKSEDFADESLDEQLRDDTLTQPSHAAQCDTKLLLLQALPQLSELRRKAIALRFFQELTQAQIAKQLGVSERHAGRLIESGLADLRGIMAGTFDEDQGRDDSLDDLSA